MFTKQDILGHRDL